MLIERAYKAIWLKYVTRAMILLGISLISLVVSVALSHMRTEAGGQMLIHAGLMVVAAILMGLGLVFLRRARSYRDQGVRIAKACRPKSA